MINSPNLPPPTPIRVAIVEDCDDILSQTVAFLNAEPDIECVGEYTTAEGLTADMDRICPDVVLMSIGARAGWDRLYVISRLFTSASPAY